MENLTFYHTWLPFIYLYGVGGIAFLIGMFLIMRTRALSLDKIHHKKWLSYLFLDLFITQVYMELL